MQVAASPHLFENFGDITYQNVCKFGQKFIRNVSHTEDSNIIFKKNCLSILSSGDDFNVLEFHNLVFHLTNVSIPKLVELIIGIFDEGAQQIKENIQNDIVNGSFTLEGFTKYYNSYLTNSMALSRYLTYFDNKIMMNNSTKYSYIGMVRKYMFYRNIINTTYNYQNNNIYMYEILRREIENMDMNNESNINIIKQLFRMYSFYNRMSHTIKKNKHDLFNDEIDNLFLSSLGSNNAFVKTISYYIHNSIKQLVSSDDPAYENISNLINLISSHFNEKVMFNMYYEKLLELRLLNDETNIDIEMKLTNNFSRPKDNNFIQNLLNKLEDIQTIESDDKILHTKIELQITEEKYKNKIDPSKINLKLLKAKIFRNYAWSYSRIDEPDDSITIPFDVAPYIDIYNQYYKIKYPYRKLEWNFNLGVGVIRIKLGEKYYNLQLNTPQMLLLLQFNERAEFTALELSSNMGLPMSKLGKILNSLLKSKILKRDSTKEKNDQSMNFFLNQEFYYDKENISLVGLTNTQPPVNKSSNTDNFTIVKETILKTLRNSGKLIIPSLFQDVKNNISFTLTEQQFKMCINLLKSNGLVNQLDPDTLEYVDQSSD
jgi:hypothetical protein